MGVCNCSMFCCTLLFVHSSIAIILMGKRELIALLNLSSWCLVMVERLFLAVPRGCLQFVIVVFPDHTHLLFLKITLSKISKVLFFNQNDLGSCPKRTFGIMPKVFFKILFLQMALGMIPKVLFRAQSQNIFQSKCFGIVPEQNFWDHAQSNFEFFILKMTLDMILKVLFWA